MTRTLFEVGHLVTTAELNQLADHTIWRFTGNADRNRQTAGVTVPPGTICYVASRNELQMFVNGSWRKLVGIPDVVCCPPKKFGQIPYNPKFTSAYQTGCWTMAELHEAQSRGVVGWSRPAITGFSREVVVDNHVHAIFDAGSHTANVLYNTPVQIVCCGGGGGAGYQEVNRINQTSTYTTSAGGGGGAGGMFFGEARSLPQNSAWTVTVAEGGSRSIRHTNFTPDVNGPSITRGTSGGSTQMVATTADNTRIAFGRRGGPGGTSHPNLTSASSWLNGHTSGSGGGGGARRTANAFHEDSNADYGSGGGQFGNPPQGNAGGNAGRVRSDQADTQRFGGGGGGGFSDGGRYFEMGSGPGGYNNSDYYDADDQFYHYTPGGPGWTGNLEGTTQEYSVGGDAQRITVGGSISGSEITVPPTERTTAGCGGRAAATGTIAFGGGISGQTPLSTDGCDGILVIRYPITGLAEDLTIVGTPNENPT